MLGSAHSVLAMEARSLRTRLEGLRPFVLHTPAVAAAMVTPAAQAAMEAHMQRERRRLQVLVQRFLDWLTNGDGRYRSAREVQRRFTLLRLHFNNVVSQFDIFADVLSQRSEQDTGVWVAGLDAAAADALRLPGFYESPPVVCYLDRGHGAAIRRARTRLPGGELNPVAIIRVPRERMVGAGIASSLVHEVGHQAAALLDLVASLRQPMQALLHKGGTEQVAWQLWERWLSEIVADFWSVARVGVASTLGLIGVVSLPRAFVFRLDVEDPHPIPWIRVRLSCAMGATLYPHPQWSKLAALWEAMYPRAGLPSALNAVLDLLEQTMPAFVRLLADHRPARLRGQSLREVLQVERRQPAELLRQFHAWRREPPKMGAAAPGLTFAVLGQARAMGLLGAEQESASIGSLLTHWASRRAVALTAACATRTSKSDTPPMASA